MKKAFLTLALALAATMVGCAPKVQMAAPEQLAQLAEMQAESEAAEAALKKMRAAVEERMTTAWELAVVQEETAEDAAQLAAEWKLAVAEAKVAEAAIWALMAKMTWQLRALVEKQDEPNARLRIFKAVQAWATELAQVSAEAAEKAEAAVAVIEKAAAMWEARAEKWKNPTASRAWDTAQEAEVVAEIWEETAAAWKELAKKAEAYAVAAEAAAEALAEKR